MTSEHIEIVPVAVGQYADPYLPPMDTDEPVGALVQSLAEFGGVLIGWDTPMPDRGADAVADRLATWSRSEHPRSVLYWVGHASPNQREPRLAHARSQERQNRPGLTARHIAEVIASRTCDDGGHWHIVIIDTCWSAAFVKKVSAALDDLPWRPAVLRGVFGVHVGAEAAAVDLTGADLHQFLRHRRVRDHPARRDDVPQEPGCDRGAEEAQASIHGELLCRSLVVTPP